VIIQHGDIFGDGVNVAARLETLAEPGGICISRTVRNQVRDKLPYDFEDMGEQSVKNIARPVRVDALSAAAVAATPAVKVKPLGLPQSLPAGPVPRHRQTFVVTGLAAIICAGTAVWWISTHAGQMLAAPQHLLRIGGQTKPASRLSIVVLPFANLANDPDQEYFADGITDDLTTDLSRIDGSFVIARTTAFTYKGKAFDVKQIGRELDVRYALEGSVRRIGDQVQINVQLIDTRNGAYVWADRFDSDRANLAKAQDEIVGRLARSLQLELLQAAGRQIEQEANPDAQDLVMRGWASYHRPVNDKQAQETREYFEQALAMDPKSLDARVGLAQTLVENYIKGTGASPKQDLARADALLSEVFQRNRNDAKALLALGLVRRNQGCLDEARMAFEEALRLNRNFTTAMTQLGYTLAFLGEPEAALPYFEKALQINSQDQNIFYAYAGLGYCHILLGHPAQAVEFLKKAHTSGAKVFYIPELLAAALALNGDVDDAKIALDEFLKLKPKLNSLTKLRAASAVMYGNPKYARLAEKTIDLGLRRAGMLEE